MSEYNDSVITDHLDTQASSRCRQLEVDPKEGWSCRRPQPSARLTRLREAVAAQLFSGRLLKARPGVK